jgi:hypothetical protein
MQDDSPDTTQQQQQQQQQTEPAAGGTAANGTHRRVSARLAGCGLAEGRISRGCSLSDFLGLDSGGDDADSGLGDTAAAAAGAAGTAQDSNGAPAGQQQQQQQGPALREVGGEKPALALHKLWSNEPATESGSDSFGQVQQLLQRLEERRQGLAQELQLPLRPPPPPQQQQQQQQQYGQAGRSTVVEVIELLSDSE